MLSIDNILETNQMIHDNKLDVLHNMLATGALIYFEKKGLGS